MRMVDRSGYELLTNPILNKGTAFTEHERDVFELHGLLPPHVASLDQQVQRRIAAFRELPDDLARYVFLRGLQDINETLHYALLTRHLEEMLPIVYTPTVGLGCQKFSQVFRRPRGLFLSPPYKDQIGKILGQRRFDNVQVIVVTDGERILGLGDQGAGGMGIPIGKLSLYTAAGGIDPSRTLPIMLDVGTDNQTRREDPLYVGWRHERLRGPDYDDFVETFVDAVAKRWPHVLLQWEDFAGPNAARLLERYRDRLCTFNDDIQGTAAVVCGALLSAVRAAGQSLQEQRIVMAGSGGAGSGIAALLVKAMVEDGMPEDEARRRFYLLGSRGLLLEGSNRLQPYQVPFAHSREHVAGWTVESREAISLEEVVRHVKPTMLIGTSGQTGLFSEGVVREMAKHVARPVVFPLSNPTSQSEAVPADVMAWTGGRAVIGTGSPFAPVPVNGRAVHIDQVNNSYIFPGMGLGIVTARARRVTDTMFLAAARALADMSPARTDPNGTLLPPVDALREVSAKVGVAVALQAYKEGLAPGFDPGRAEESVKDQMWEPRYESYRRAG